jgi:hypothetical protein
MTKPKANRLTTNRSPNVLTVISTSDKPHAAQVAELALDGVTSNAITARTFTGTVYGELDLTECVSALKECAKRVHDGELAYLETTLTAQAANLNAMFNELARRAMLNMGEHLDATDRYMRLALKAQSQCRATLETLAAIKNPPIVFARQANITNGPQQVNNGYPSSGSHVTRAGKSEKMKNELLEGQDHGNVDNRASLKTGGAHSTLATMEPIHRATNSRR